MSQEQGLFDAEPVSIEPGDRVMVQTIYGREEGLVLEKGAEDGFPMIQIRTFSGDVITIGIARVSKVERKTGPTGVVGGGLNA